tara:strand:- start:423 stop:836 length:414 start_codon:yes stop_codon:yes gene_type:complete
MYEYAVKEVVKVVDGDTVDVIVDLGFDILHKTRVRLYGINTPETRTRDLEEKARGLMAKERLIELIPSHLLNNLDEDMYPRPSSLLLSTKEKGKFGRYLGTFYKAYWDSDKEEYIKLNLNETLVEEGHATEYFGGKR